MKPMIDNSEQNSEQNPENISNGNNLQGAKFGGGFTLGNYIGDVYHKTYNIIIKFPNLLNYRKPLLILASFLMSLITTFLLIRDDISREFSQIGRAYYLVGHLEQAKQSYQIAIALYSDAETHYFLGLLYEDLQETELAIKEYQLAVQRDKTETLLSRLKAYNNWGRLLIRQAKYKEAIIPLIKGNNLINDGQVKSDSEFKKVKYTLLKNLGWAQLEQGNLTESRSLLVDAITLNEEQGAAHCLMAQVMEKEGKNVEAIQKWEDCLKFANKEVEEEYNWIVEARTKVNDF